MLDLNAQAEACAFLHVADIFPVGRCDSKNISTFAFLFIDLGYNKIKILVIGVGYEEFAEAGFLCGQYI